MAYLVVQRSRSYERVLIVLPGSGGTGFQINQGLLGRIIVPRDIQSYVIRGIVKHVFEV